jgi:hypothetical protein
VAGVSPDRAATPPLHPFGLVLHHDGSWSHEGQPIRHERLRRRFDRAVRYLPGEGVYVVQVGRYRGQIEVEEAAFFVREVDLARALLRLSDGSQAPLEPETLRLSPRDGALLATVKRGLAPGGLPARFQPAAHAELLEAVEIGNGGPRLFAAGAWHALPGLREGAPPI